MKSFFPILPHGLYTLDTYRNSTYQINKIFLIGTATSDNPDLNPSFDVDINYGTLGSTIYSNSKSGNVTLNFLNPTIAGEIIEMDITSLILPFVGVNDVYSINIRNLSESNFLFSLLQYELVII